MKNFKFIKIYSLTEEQLLHIAQLFIEAEYGDNQPDKEFNALLDTKADKLACIKPYTEITYVLMDKKDDEVVGFFIAANKHQIKAVSKNILSWRKKDPEFMSCLNFYINEAMDSDFVLHDIAIALKYRGLGCFKILKNNLTQLAALDNCKRIVFAVWDCNPAAEIYRRHGAQILGEINFSNKNYTGKLIKCFFAT